MCEFVESLRRLYIDKKVSKEKIMTLYGGGKITQGAMDYILKSE